MFAELLENVKVALGFLSKEAKESLSRFQLDIRKTDTGGILGSNNIFIRSTSDDLKGVFHKGKKVFEGTEKEVNKFLESLAKKSDVEGEKYLDELLESIQKRRAALVKHANKFDKGFFNHILGEFNTKIYSSKYINFKTEFLVSQGGHILNKNLKVTKIDIPPDAYVNSKGEIVNLADDVAFKGSIEVKYRDGWLPKDQKSSIFPKNWSLERIQEEVAFVYANTVAKGNNFLKTKIVDGKNIHQYRGTTTEGFDIIIEVDDLENIINSYPK